MMSRTEIIAVDAVRVGKKRCNALRLQEMCGIVILMMNDLDEEGFVLVG